MARASGNREDFSMAKGELGLAERWAHGRGTRVRWENHRDNPEAPILRGRRERSKLGGAKGSEDSSRCLSDKGGFKVSPNGLEGQILGEHGARSDGPVGETMPTKFLESLQGAWAKAAEGLEG